MTKSVQQLPQPNQDLNNLMEVYTSKLEQKIANEALFFRLMSDTLPQIVWTAESDGLIDYFNKRWFEYTALPTEETYSYDYWIQALHPEDRKRIRQLWESAVKTGKPYEAECRFKDGQNGNYRWFLSRALPGRDTHGEIIKWFGTCTDIDDHKKAQEKKDEFIAIASHELKTPVTSIKAFTQLLEKRALAAGQTDIAAQLSKMDAQVNKLTNLIKDLLDVSKIESGKLVLHQEIFEFDEFIKDTVDNLQLANDSHRIEIQGLTGARVYADRDRIEQVLINFISNGVKYSPQAQSITIHLSCDGEFITVGVEDFGVGVPKKDLNRIFERFYRVSGPKSDTFPGLGLGLFISAEIIRRQKGNIWVESRPGKGSIFYFSLPCKQPRKKKR